MRFAKISEMGANVHRLVQRELEVHEVMNVHREEGIFSFSLSLLRVHEGCRDFAGFPNFSL